MAGPQQNNQTWNPQEESYDDFRTRVGNPRSQEEIVNEQAAKQAQVDKIQKTNAENPVYGRQGTTGYLSSGGLAGNNRGMFANSGTGITSKKAGVLSYLGANDSKANTLAKEAASFGGSKGLYNAGETALDANILGSAVSQGKAQIPTAQSFGGNKEAVRQALQQKLNDLSFSGTPEDLLKQYQDEAKKEALSSAYAGRASDIQSATDAGNMAKLKAILSGSFAGGEDARNALDTGAAASAQAAADEIRAKYGAAQAARQGQVSAAQGQADNEAKMADIVTRQNTDNYTAMITNELKRLAERGVSARDAKGNITPEYARVNALAREAMAKGVDPAGLKKAIGSAGGKGATGYNPTWVLKDIDSNTNLYQPVQKKTLQDFLSGQTVTL